MLCESDLRSRLILCGFFVDILKRDERNTAEKKGSHHDMRITEKEVLDERVERKTENARREKAHNKPLDELDVEERFEVERYNGADSAELNSNIEAFHHIRLLYAEQFADQYQMPRG